MIKYGIKFLEENKTQCSAIQKELWFSHLGDPVVEPVAPVQPEEPAEEDFITTDTYEYESNLKEYESNLKNYQDYQEALQEATDNFEAFENSFDLIVDEIPQVSSEYILHDGMTIYVDEDRQALDFLSDLESNQWSSAFQRQEALGYDSNMMSLISGISSACAITGTPVPPMCQACKDALDELWTEKYRRVFMQDENLDYSGFGSMPYSYTEVRTESETN